MAEMALIQAVSMAIQAATATPVVSATMGTTGYGGLLQSPVPTHGSMDWAAASAMSAEATTFEAAAFLLVASGIKNFKL